MKLKQMKLGLCTALSICLMAPVYADIIVHGNSNLKDEDLCDQVAGFWTGEGTVSLGLTCHYKGTANIVKTGPESLQMTVVLDKTSGVVCPAHEELPLTGLCKNNAIKIDTDSGTHLTGDLSDGGHKAKVTGKVQYSIFPLHVDIDLKK